MKRSDGRPILLAPAEQTYSLHINRDYVDKHQLWVTCSLTNDVTGELMRKATLETDPKIPFGELRKIALQLLLDGGAGTISVETLK